MEVQRAQSAAPFPLYRTLLAAIGGFVVTAYALHFVFQRPINLYAQIRSEKLTILDDWNDRVTTAAFGSSHVDNGFDPRVFDEELGQAGLSTTSLNLGVSGGSQTEQRAVAEEFLKDLPAGETSRKSRLLLMEINASANFTFDHLFHPRAINIYDLATVRFAFAFANPRAIGWHRAAGRGLYALAAGILHYVNVGMLSSEIFPAPLSADLFASQTIEDRRGLTPNQNSPSGSEDDLANQQIIQAAKSTTPVEATGEVLEGHRELIEDLAPAMQEKRVQLVYFVTPRLDNLLQHATYPAWIEGPHWRIPVLDVAVPSEHPELYDPALWHDPTHLTEPGAELFTRLLAKELLRRVQAGDLS